MDAGFRVITFDNRDMGNTQRFDELVVSEEMQEPGGNPEMVHAYTTEDMAADAAAVLGHYGVAKAHIIGYSMGGQISQIFLTNYPEKCISVTLVMTSAAVQKWGGAAYEMNPEWFGQFMEAMGSC